MKNDPKDPDDLQVLRGEVEQAIRSLKGWTSVPQLPENKTNKSSKLSCVEGDKEQPDADDEGIARRGTGRLQRSP